MDSLRTDIRNLYDYIKYGVRIKELNIISILINSFILIFACIQYREIVEQRHIMEIILLFLVNVVWQIISTVSDFKRFFTKKGDRYFSPINMVSPSFRIDEVVSDEYDTINVTELGISIIYRKDINAILRSDDIAINAKEVYRKNKRIRKYIEEYKDILISFLNLKWFDVRANHGAFYNETKLCMASDFERVQGGYVLRVNKGCYYDSFLTNDIYMYYISQQSGFYINAPLNCNNYPIMPLNKSLMNNGIGVSTLAVTTDNHILIMRHNNRSAVNTGKLIPSGSGSMDYNDFRQGEDFRKTISFAVERELMEETGINQRHIQSTQILGFYRNLNRGGKPEFCCLTKINLSMNDLVEEVCPDSSEQRDDFELFPLIYNNGMVDSQKMLKDFIAEFGRECSASLYFNLFFLA